MGTTPDTMAACWSFSWGNGNQLRRKKRGRWHVRLGSQLAAPVCFGSAGSLPEQRLIFSKGRSPATWPHTFQRLVFRNIVKQTKTHQFLFFFLLQRVLPVGGKRNSGCTKKLTRRSGQPCGVYPENRCRSPSPLPRGQGQASSGLACWYTANIHGLLGLKGA